MRIRAIRFLILSLVCFVSEFWLNIKKRFINNLSKGIIKNE